MRDGRRSEEGGVFGWGDRVDRDAASRCFCLFKKRDPSCSVQLSKSLLGVVVVAAAVAAVVVVVVVVVVVN